MVTESEQDTTAAGEQLAAILRPGDVLAFFGEIGAGKTAFIRGIAKGLRLNSRVSSPTFTIVNEYLGDIPLFHFDMYRLSSADELFEIGWEDYLARGGVCCVEWSENVDGAFPDNTIRVIIEKLGDTRRGITVSFPDGRSIW